MYITVGGRATLYDGNDQSAIEFASRMNDGESIVTAWNESAWYADNNNSPQGLASGKDDADCVARLDLTLDTMFTTGILRDSSIGALCARGWN
jgi:hypothetical protein